MLESSLKPSLTPGEKVQVGLHFENLCGELKHSKCKCCLRVKIKSKVNDSGICSLCVKFGQTDYYETKQALPMWYKGGMAQYHVPEELQDLTLAEKLLIQRASPFVPLRFIKNGIFGLSGHVCTFEQDVEGFVNRLPMLLHTLVKETPHYLKKNSKQKSL